MSGYTKLFSSILESTVWELPATTKVVWITMLLMPNRDGVIEASVPGLAKRAGVTVDECETALASFMSPDRYSRTQEHGGRRIEVVDGGWRLLTFDKYRNMLSADDRRERAAERQRRWKERHGNAKSNAGALPLTGDDEGNDIPAPSESPSQAQAVNRSEKKDSPRPADRSSGTPISELTFPCDGKAKTWTLTREQLAEWSDLYPSLDLLNECRKALAWVRAKPARRKTFGGMPAFLVNWFNGEQNRGGAARAGPLFANPKTAGNIDVLRNFSSTKEQIG